MNNHDNSVFIKLDNSILLFYQRILMYIRLSSLAS